MKTVTHSKSDLKRRFFSPRKSTALAKFVLFAVSGLPILVGLTYVESELLGGCAFFFISFGVLMGIVGVGLCMIPWLSKLLRLSPSSPSAIEIGEWLNEDVSSLKQHALSTLGLVEDELESDLLTVVGPVMWDTGGVPESELVFREVDSGNAFFGVYNIAFIALAEQRLAAFNCLFRFISSEVVQSKSCEFQYSDIVSVSTTEEASSLRTPLGTALPTVQRFRISTRNGESLSTTINTPELPPMVEIDTLPRTGAERAVRAIRTKLRESTDRLGPTLP